MNRFERIKENLTIDSLVNLITLSDTDICKKCIHLKDCPLSIHPNYNCKKGIKEWLLKEVKSSKQSTTKEKYEKWPTKFFLSNCEKPSWENEKYKYYVLDQTKMDRYLAVGVKEQKTNTPKTFLIYDLKINQPIKEISSMESIGIEIAVLNKLEKEGEDND